MKPEINFPAMGRVGGGVDGHAMPDLPKGGVTVWDRSADGATAPEDW